MATKKSFTSCIPPVFDCNWIITAYLGIINHRSQEISFLISPNSRKLTSVEIIPGKKCFVDPYSKRGSFFKGFYTIKNGKKKALASFCGSETKPAGKKYTRKKSDGTWYYFYNLKVNGKKASYIIHPFSGKIVSQ